jgi:predicted short-subunit dehydrogenase-like oxidoreductase (DUF2520 family)
VSDTTRPDERIFDMTTRPRACVVVGAGRAGGAFHGALTDAGWDVIDLPGRGVGAPGTATGAGSGRDATAGPLGAADLVLLTVPDDAVADVARALPPTTAVVAHVAGSLGLDVLAPHHRVASIHPLMSLPDATTGARRLREGCTFAVAGDPIVVDVVADLGGTAVEVPDDRRALYHGAATVAANHLTALCDQVERLADLAGIPAAAYWRLMDTTLQNVGRVGARAALTGPAARGDWRTLRRHLQALPDDERALYVALGRRAAALGGRELPADIVALAARPVDRDGRRRPTGGRATRRGAGPADHGRDDGPTGAQVS